MSKDGMSKDGMIDDTDKLAAQMKDLRPSEAARERGMNAAMAAFNQEFVAENVSVKAGISEKTSEHTQGLTDTARPIGNPTKTVRVKTRRVETMTKLKNAFNFKPQNMMMAGTCAAALMAAVIVLPNMDKFGVDRFSKPAVKTVTDAPKATEVIKPAPPAEVVVTGPAPMPEPVAAPRGEGQSLDQFLSEMPKRPEASPKTQPEQQVTPSLQGALPSFSPPPPSRQFSASTGAIVNQALTRIPQAEVS